MPRKDTNNAPKSEKGQRDGANISLPRDEHTSVNDFNAQEVKSGLQKTSEPRPTIYKLPKSDNAGSKSGNGPWAAKCKMRSFPFYNTHLLTIQQPTQWPMGKTSFSNYGSRFRQHNVLVGQHWAAKKDFAGWHFSWSWRIT